MGGTFYEQVEGIAQIFDGWTVCERTVVLCALLRRVPWSSLKLVKCTIEAGISQHTDDDAQRLESDANDAQYLSNFLKRADSEEQDCGEKLRKLLVYLPLLKPGNDEAKEFYLSSVPHFVQNCVDTSKNTDECQQLLSYMLIHPGVNGNDRRSLGHWLRFLENHIWGKISKENMWQQRTDSNNACSKTWNPNKSSSFRRTVGKNIDFKSAINTALSNEEQSQNTKIEAVNLQESFSKNGIEIDTSIECEKASFDTAIIQPKKRSNSLTPPTPSYIHMSSSAENLHCDNYFIQKPRSFSLSSEHSLANLKAISAIAASGSETRLDDLRANNVADHHEGMSNIGLWLKSLRLHKYIWLFSNISYDEMININEEYLEKLSVTKGARHKLLLSIKKLSDRHTTLKAMERDLATGSLMSISSMNALLDQLRNIIISPIKPSSKLPTQIVKILDLASTRLLTGGVSPSVPNGSNHARCLTAHHPDDTANLLTPACEPVSLHCWLVDKALSHEAFCRNTTILASLKALKYRMPPRQFFSHLSDAPFSRRPKPRWRSNNGTHHQQAHSNYHSQGSNQPTVNRKPPPQWSVTSDWSNEELPGKSQHSTDKGKSSSYPSFPPQPQPRQSEPTPPRLSCPYAMSASLGDINSRLESLCLQMTEQAIN